LLFEVYSVFGGEFPLMEAQKNTPVEREGKKKQPHGSMLAHRYLPT
jgi:hypothetical protein